MTETSKHPMSDALREAGWVEVDAADLRAGEKAFVPGVEAVYDPAVHGGAGYTLLVHPNRPGSVCVQPGSCALVLSGSGQVTTMLRSDHDTWIDSTGRNWADHAVTVLRVLCAPDGEAVDQAVSADHGPLTIRDLMEHPDRIAVDDCGALWCYVGYDGHFESWESERLGWRGKDPFEAAYWLTVEPSFWASEEMLAEYGVRDSGEE